jgi:hypothetical protein
VSSAGQQREGSDGIPDAGSLRRHADRIRVDGYTVLEGALPLAFIGEMRERFDALLEEYRDANPTNRGANRYQMYLPWEPPFSSPTLIEHPEVLSVVQAILGERVLLGYLASDTPLPGSDYQTAHLDSELLFPESGVATPCFALVVNVPLVDVTEENGPLEIWPGGTHNMPVPVDIPSLAETLVSRRLTMMAGDVLVRDPRAWHRGTPNRGTRSRPNVALVYTRPWYRFAQEPPTLRGSQLDSLSDRAKAMLRHARLTEG